MPNPIETQHLHLTKQFKPVCYTGNYIVVSNLSPAWCYCNELNDSSGESMQTKIRLLKEQYDENLQFASFRGLHNGKTSNFRVFMP